jgi:hypothetical protein
VTDPSGSPAKPLLRVVRGNPTAEELGAVVALLATRSAGTAEATDAPAAASRWGRPQLRQPVVHGHGAWMGSALPR